MSLDYHRQTAYTRQELGGHNLDWSLRPHPFKRFLDREILPLAPPRWPRAGFFDLALGEERLPPAKAPTAADLAATLWLAAGLTAQVAADPEGGGLRAWASAGALYPCELYCNSCGVAGLEDGLYHFAPQGPGLTPLWPGAHAADLARRLERPATTLNFFISAYYWRSLWKYRARAYRYCLLDAGHLAANLELATAAAGFPARPVLDFPDRSVNVFLGLASDDEAALVILTAGPAPATPGPDQAGLPPFDRQSLPLSARMGRDAAVLNAHAEGMLDEAAPPRLWPRPKFSAEPIPLPAPEAGGPDLRAVLASRRSRRNFVPGLLDAGQVARLLAAALPDQGPCLATVLLGPGGELSAGVYLYLPRERALAPLGAVDQRVRVATACLNQLWVGQASLVLLLWADLELLQENGGPRTYRHAMLFAGRAGQRLYLAATAQGLGCCGVGAFYDRELAEAAGLPPRGWPLYLLACGPVKGGPRQS